MRSNSMDTCSLLSTLNPANLIYETMDLWLHLAEDLLIEFSGAKLAMALS